MDRSEHRAFASSHNDDGPERGRMGPTLSTRPEIRGEPVPRHPGLEQTLRACLARQDVQDIVFSFMRIEAPGARAAALTTVRALAEHDKPSG